MTSPTPKKRCRAKSDKTPLKKTPRDSLLSHSFNEQSPFLCEENDDDAERRQRQKLKVLEMQRKNMPSPVMTKSIKGASLTGLSNSQITDHYKNCIKLSSENKITSKNAFGLHLIDYMSQMLQDREEGMTNFQMASCTLDASTKIYSHRVDVIHADVYKMAGGLGQTNNKKSKDGNKDGDQFDLDDSNETKRKKKNKKSKTIATNINTLNMKKLDERFEVDPLFKKLSATFDEGGVKSLLMNSLKTRNNCLELLLDSSSNLKSSETNETGAYSQNVTKSDLKCFFDIDWDAQICPPFADFCFRNWNASKHDVFGKDNNLVGLKTSTSHAFDMNAEPEPVEDEAEYEPNDDFGGFPDNDDDDDEDAWNSKPDKSLFQPMKLESVEALTHILSDKPSEYSYFDTRLLSTWAGPNHWRIRPFSKVNVDNKEKKETKKKVPLTIDYSEELDIEKLFKKAKKSIRLENKTLQQWSKNKTTMPEDLHYDGKNLFQLFLKSSIKIKLSKQSSEIDDGIAQYNYNNVNDCENFCPPSQDNDDSDGCNFDDGMDVSANYSMSDPNTIPSTDFCGDNLLQQPYKVAKINIDYARTAKKVDVQKLKSKMWNIMTDSCSDSNKENIANNCLPDKIENEMDFSGLYQNLSTKLPNSIRENLSVHLTFVCFLHLVNEKCLKLVTHEDMSDFSIFQDG